MNTPTDAGAEVIALAIKALRAYRGHTLEDYIAMRDDIVAHYRKFGKEADATARRDADIERLTKERAEVDAAIDSLSAALAGDGWVSVKERMPPRNRFVIIAAINSGCPGDIITCSATHDPEMVGQKREWYSRDDGWSVHVSQCGEVTHWRPLPPNPPAMDATREGK